MRRSNREFNIFNLSMLDVMTGALGAVLLIMIVLLTQKIGIESTSCQAIVEELKTSTDELIKTRKELQTTQHDLKNVQKKEVSIIDKILSATGLIDKTSNNISKTVDKIKNIPKDLFRARAKDVMAFKIPKKLVMVVDLSGSMTAKNNKYNEDRLSQVKAAIKMFIAGMGEDYALDIVFFPAFKENINMQLCSDFKIAPEIDKKCLQFEMRDEAYDNKNLSCYKYGYLNGSLKNIVSENDKYWFYKKIACLEAYHDTPTKNTLEFVLGSEKYQDAEGIIIFSDGEPDSIKKKLLSIDELLKIIKSKNSNNKKIFSVGIGAEFRNQENTIAVEFLKKLAEQNNGFYIGF